MKYKLKQDRTPLAIYNSDFNGIEKEIEHDVRKMSFYHTSKPPMLVLGSWPGIALWKIKVQFTTGVEKDFSYKTEEVKE